MSFDDLKEALEDLLPGASFCFHGKHLIIYSGMTVDKDGYLHEIDEVDEDFDFQDKETSFEDDDFSPSSDNN